MRFFDPLAKVFALVAAFSIALYLAGPLHGGGLWEGLTPAMAAGNAASPDRQPAPYDLTQVKVVNEVLKFVHDRYVDPRRVALRNSRANPDRQLRNTRSPHGPAEVRVRERIRAATPKAKYSLRQTCMAIHDLPATA